MHMNHSMLEKINKININPERVMERDISVLWITAATGENKNTLTFRNHSHTFYEIHIILEGEVTYGIQDETVKVGAGRLFIIEPRLTHRVIGHSESFFKITIAVEDIAQTEFFGRTFDGGRHMMTIPKGIENSINFLAETRKSYGKYADAIIESRLREIVYVIADTVSVGAVRHGEEYDARIFRAKKYIEDNPSCFFTCADIAIFCRLSEKQVSRLFLKHEGVSLLSYIHAQKLALAKRMLCESDDPQESIAFSLGFSSVHYFNKFFLKHEAISPGEYRKLSNG